MLTDYLAPKFNELVFEVYFEALDVLLNGGPSCCFAYGRSIRPADTKLVKKTSVGGWINLRIGSDIPAGLWLATKESAYAHEAGLLPDLLEDVDDGVGEC